MATDQERIGKLEGEVVTMKVQIAVAQTDIATVKGKLDKIDNNVNKLLWIVVGAVILAILNSVLGGKL